MILIISTIVPSCLKPSSRRKPPNRSDCMTPMTEFRCTVSDRSVRGAMAKSISFRSVWWKSFFFRNFSAACLIVASVMVSFIELKYKNDQKKKKNLIWLTMFDGLTWWCQKANRIHLSLASASKSSPSLSAQLFVWLPFSIQCWT